MPDRSPRTRIQERRGAAPGRPRARVSGFTLVELLVVVAILAIVAGGALVLLRTPEEHAATGVARTELVELRAAVLRFRRDTGHLPRCGPFALVSDGGLIDPADDGHWPAEAPAAAAGRAAWFRSPANFYQLFERPDALSIQVVLDVIAGPGVVFNHETGRGYRGPYVSRHTGGFVYVGDGLDPDGAGDPAGGDLLDPVPGVADPFPSRATGSNLFLWLRSPLAPPGEDGPSLLGRPFLLFVNVPAAARDPGPRLVCLGANGAYDSDETGINTAAGGDDLAVYLLE
jgi:prepilin-type N-terminal cleavage/methylation domain-containing protein